MATILLISAAILSYFTWKFSSSFFIKKGNKPINSNIAGICFALIVFLGLVNYLAPHIRVDTNSKTIEKTDK